MDQLEPQRERVQDDLRGLIAGEVRCDDSFRQLYASDGSVYEIRPLGVVRPRSVADVVACVQYAAETHIPLHARGAGSSVCGGSLGPGLVLDFSKYLRRILRVEKDQVRVQAGVVHERLCAHLRSRGRLLGPDPGSSVVTTVGGMIGVDAAGSRRGKYGSMRDQLVSLQVVLADGHVLEVGCESIEPAPNDLSRKAQLVRQLTALLAPQQELIARRQGADCVSRGGFQLAGVLGQQGLNLARLLAGSEGTLALITEATLRTHPLPRHRGVVLLLFDSLESASRTALDIRHRGPSACDLMDRRHLSLVRDAEPRFGLLIPQETEALLLVEYEGQDPLEVRQWVQRLVDELRSQLRRTVAARQAFDPAEVEFYWHLATRFQPAFFRLKGPARPVPVVEDMAIPPESLPDFLVRLQNVLKRHEVTASVFAHATQGQVHVRPFVDMASAADVARLRSLADDLYGEVFAMGGAVGGENGIGISRTAYLQRQYGELYDLCCQVKQSFDPQNLFNPGKIIAGAAEQVLEHLRAPLVRPAPAPQSPTPSTEPALRNLVELQLNWDPSLVTDSAEVCNGCGECRSQVAGVRMCPIFRFSPAEESSPRAKANLLRGVLSGRLDLSCLTSEDFKRIADLCVHCHMCRLECPASVDIPRLMRESKGAYVAANGLRLGDWVMTRLDLLGALGTLCAPVTNWALSNRQMRWLLEKTLGIAQGRKLPRVGARSFLRRCHGRRLSRPSRRSGQKVFYFVDVYANYYDLMLAEALVNVMEHNGVEVYVHPGQKQAGMAAIARGALDYARRLAEHNTALLAEAVRQGYRIVASEPAAVLCLTREYPQLLDDEDARLVAAHTSEACSYLWNMHTLGKLQLDFRPIHTALAYHMPCHLKALQVGSPGLSLLGLIPGLQLFALEEGCSGMAGTFGLQRQNYRASLRAGWALISRLRDPRIHAGTTECSACKMQMEQGTTKPTIHPLKVLALAYGRMPEIAPLLSTPGSELIVT